MLSVISHRAELGLSCSFDAKLDILLAECIWSLEAQKLSADVSQEYPEFFQSGIRRAIPSGHTFKGLPYEFQSANAQKMFSRISRLESFNNLLSLRADAVRFVVKVKIFPYPEDTMACWLMIGVRFSSFQ